MVPGILLDYLIAGGTYDMKPGRWSGLHLPAARLPDDCGRGHTVVHLLLLSLFLTLLVVPVLGGTETLITVNTSTSSQSDPVIYGDWIVWTDDRQGSAQIFGYHIVTGEERQLSSSAAIATQPEIFGDRIVWRDDRSGDYDIYLYNLTTEAETRITQEAHDQQLPVIFGDLIAWEDNRNGVADIYLYDLRSSQESLLTPDTADTKQEKPAISGTKVVWQDYRNYYSDPAYCGLEAYYADILMNDTSTGELTNVSHDSADPGYDELAPAISGDIVVWGDERYGEKGDIYMNDTQSGSQQAVAENLVSFKTLPAIDDTQVVWLDNRDRDPAVYDYDIYLRDLSTLPGGSDTRITGPEAVPVSSGKGPKISGNRIVWTDTRNGNEDVYLYTIGAAETCPVAGFTLSAQDGPAPLTVTFTDTSTAGTSGITHRTWEFGDGNSTTDSLNPTWTYEVPGTYDVRLTVSNALCRNETPVSALYRVSTGVAPVSSFSASPVSGMVPLTVSFTDSSVGATTWNWSFGDGAYSDAKSPSHTYSDGGTYTAILNASNTYGYSKSSRTIQGLTGANVTANTSVSGITVDYRYGSQFLIFDGATLAGYSNDPVTGVLVSPPVTSEGWQNITFVTSDPGGFYDCPGNSTFMGNISTVILQTVDIVPAGFSNDIGKLSSVNYSVTLDTYPEDAVLNTQIWEGYTDEDLSAFTAVSRGSGYTYLWDVAYTTKVVKTNFPSGGTGRLYMSVNSSWVDRNPGRDHTFVERISDDRLTGEVLEAQYLSSDEDAMLDLFLIDSPHGTSTFGLVHLSGSGNPLQLITLSISSYVSAGSSSSTANTYQSSGATSDSDSPSGGAGSKSGSTAPASQLAPPEEAPAPADPGKTGSVYTDPAGVTTQATTLVATDGLAVLSIPEGVHATDAGGNPLGSVTMAAVSDIPPEGPSGGTIYSFAGMAYNIGPDGAHFSPAITLSFTVPQASWSQDYTIRSYDPATKSWVDLPTTFDPATGKVTAQVSDFCYFALFTITPRETPAPARAPVETPAIAATPSPPPPSTAINIFSGMMLWVGDILLGNVVVVAGAGIIGGTLLLVYYRRSQKPFR